MAGPEGAGRAARVAAGSYDAITAPGAAKSAAAGLTHATFLLIPGVGHFAIPKSDCAKHVMLSFLDDPGRPEMDCVSIMKPPAFVIGKE